MNGNSYLCKIWHTQIVVVRRPLKWTILLREVSIHFFLPWPLTVISRSLDTNYLSKYRCLGYLSTGQADSFFHDLISHGTTSDWWWDQYLEIRHFPITPTTNRNNNCKRTHALYQNWWETLFRTCYRGSAYYLLLWIWRKRGRLVSLFFRGRDHLNFLSELPNFQCFSIAIMLDHRSTAVLKGGRL